MKGFPNIRRNIVYITLANIKMKISEIKESLINTKGIIIDIRNYPSAFVPFSLGSHFVSETHLLQNLLMACWHPGICIFR